MALLTSLFREIARGFRRESHTSGALVSTSHDNSDTHATDARAQASTLALLDPSARIDRIQELLLDGKSRADVEGLRQLGDHLLDTQLLDEAELVYRQALQIRPLHAKSHEGLGLCLLRKGQIEEAYLRLETASKLAPENSDIWVHWGLVDLEFGQFAKAANKFQKAIDRAPENAHAWHNLALTSLKLHDLPASLNQFRRALTLKPDMGLAHSNHALALLHDDQLGAAAEAARRAVELKPSNARVHVVLSEVLLASGDLDAAQRALATARQIDPRFQGAEIGYAKLCMATARYDQARRSFETVLALDANNAEAQAGLGQLKLLLGEWAGAWTLYEARRRTVESPVRSFPYPEWEGEPCPDQHVLVHAEQGLGDIILFASCLSDLMARCPAVVIEVPSRMSALFRRSFPTAVVIGHEPNDKGQGWLGEGPRIDRHVPFGTLPRWLRQGQEAFGNVGAFLTADPIQVADWRAKRSPGNRLHVGITWRGGLAFTARHQRSLSLVEVATALAPLGVQLVCLQHGNVAEELAQCEALTGVHVDPGLSGFADIDALAALTVACDAVVTVCSTQAHLTGALGHPGLALVPHAPNWRYGASGDHSTWYPSLRLARQSEAGDWQSPLSKAKKWLAALQAGDLNGTEV